ncbi:MAG TPA: biopolymer transporter ExbD [Candidatus Caccoplasma merdavium]|nr:biopolymer transporter ExbD [Candidatus Caccoplasma merdavium]
MAEVEQKDSGGKKKGKQKKMNIRVDFTPMVDMNMLLLTFFMLCTSMSKPQTMEISMPSNDKTLTEQERDKVAASRAITLILGSNDRVYYYSGEPNYEDWTSLQETTYKDDGLRAMLLYRNQEVVSQIRELKKEKIDTKMSDEEYDKRAAEIKDSKTAPIVIIKATDDATYKNLIDALDEMHICSINRYAIVDIAEGDEWLVENYEKKGELTNQIDRDQMQQQ